MDTSKLLYWSLILSLIVPPLLLVGVVVLDTPALANAFNFVLLVAFVLGVATLINELIAKSKKLPRTFPKSTKPMAIAAALSPIWLYPIYAIYIIGKFHF